MPENEHGHNGWYAVAPNGGNGPTDALIVELQKHMRADGHHLRIFADGRPLSTLMFCWISAPQRHKPVHVEF
jgi:hypothetical protein